MSVRWRCRTSPPAWTTESRRIRPLPPERAPLRRHHHLIVACLACALATASIAAPAKATPAFDYYALALAWSPTYCSSPAGEDDGLQCGGGKRFAFIVHGLWPQYDAGWPEFCFTPERTVPAERIAAMLAVMPSPQLIVHQWLKHGSCSRLPMDEYFALARSLFATVRIPARYRSPTAPIVTSPREIVSDFVSSNRGLDPSMISIRCRSRRQNARLSEVRICFSLEGTFTSCGSNERPGCKAPSLLLLPARATDRNDGNR